MAIDRPASARGPARSRGGFSLAELVTAACLVLFTLAILAQVLLPSAFFARVQEARSDVEQGALVFTHTLRRGILNASPDTVTLIAAPAAIAFAETSDEMPFDPASAAPRLVPRFRVFWFDAAERKVFTRAWPPGSPALSGYDFTDPGRPPVLSASDLRQVIQGAGPYPRVLVKNVERCIIRDSMGSSGGGALAYPLKFEITCSVRAAKPQSADQDVERFSLSMRVSPGGVRW